MTGIQVELSALTRQLGYTEISDVHLDDGQTLAVGDAVLLRDEGGFPIDARVVEVTLAKIGHRYRLRLNP